jgi:hypothetical protein
MKMPLATLTRPRLLAPLVRDFTLRVLHEESPLVRDFEASPTLVGGAPPN